MLSKKPCLYLALADKLRRFRPAGEAQERFTSSALLVLSNRLSSLLAGLAFSFLLPLPRSGTAPSGRKEMPALLETASTTRLHLVRPAWPVRGCLCHGHQRTTQLSSSSPPSHIFVRTSVSSSVYRSLAQIYFYALVAAANFASTFSQYEALRWVGFTTQALAKCAKMVSGVERDTKRRERCERRVV